MDNATSLIEVGASRGEGTIRYWWAREALRQAEMRLASQVAAVDGLMARAGWLIGWCVALTAALLVGAESGYLRPPALAGAALAIVAGVFCVAAIWPRAWRSPGEWADWAITEPYETELEGLEAMAQGAVRSIAENKPRITAIASLLRVAFLLFLSAPVAAFLALISTG